MGQRNQKRSKPFGVEITFCSKSDCLETKEGDSSRGPTTGRDGNPVACYGNALTNPLKNCLI